MSLNSIERTAFDTTVLTASGLTQWWIPFLLSVALLLLFIGALRRIQLWRRGRASPVNLVRGLIAFPRRFLVDLHHVVARDRYMSNTHIATAGGFVASAALSILIYLFELHNRYLAIALLMSTALMFIGAVFVYRRRIAPPQRLSRGPWMRLPKSLLVFAATFFIATLPLVLVLIPATAFWLKPVVGSLFAALLLVGVIWGCGELFCGMTWGGPMKHAFAGALHLGFHPRPERFGGGRSTGLKALDLNAPRLGVERPADFTWNQLLGFDACVQCGRCEQVCPAFAAGQPLNPKKLIQDLVIGMIGGSDAGFTGSPYPGIKPGTHKGAPYLPIVGDLVEADTLWSCTTCRACVEECPMMIEHVDAIVDMRRFLTLEKGQTPGKGAETLDNLIATDNPGGRAPGSRMHWAADQNLPLFSEVQQADVLLWVGDAAFDMRNQSTLRALVKLLRASGVDFAVLGDEECDCGDLARRLGDEATFQRLARHNIAVMQCYRFNEIVTADPHAYHCLRNEYRELGGEFSVHHHTGFLAGLVKAGRLHLDSRPKGQSVTYHDPCYLGRYNGEYDAPRYLLQAMGLQVKEMQRSGFRSRCCGGGGGAPVTDIPGEQRIPDMRMADARETGADMLAVACPQCSLMLEGVVAPRPEVKDVAELLLIALQEEKP